MQWQDFLLFQNFPPSKPLRLLLSLIVLSILMGFSTHKVALFLSLVWRPVLKFLRSFVYAIQIPETFLEHKHIAFAQSLTWLKNSATFYEKVPPKKANKVKALGKDRNDDISESPIF